ncbi:MAG: 50S ribosomal protein L25 [Pseudomonadota bacterium]
MELIDLSAEIRHGKGKGAARTLRRKEAMPAILYGKKTEPVQLSLFTPELNKVIIKHGMSGLFINLKIAGDDRPFRTVMLKEVQMDAFNRIYLHADFQEIDMDEKITITVPVEAVGLAKGAKAGGLLQIIRRELDIVCRPADMPETIAIDVSELEIGDAIHVNDIHLGDAISIPHEVNFTVITVVPPTTGSEKTRDEEDVEDEVAAS